MAKKPTELDEAIRSQIQTKLESLGLATYLQTIHKEVQIVVQNLPMACRIGYELKENYLTLYVSFIKNMIQSHYGAKANWYKLPFKIGIIHDPSTDVEKGIGDLVKLLNHLNQIRLMSSNTEDLSLVPFTLQQLKGTFREIAKNEIKISHTYKIQTYGYNKGDELKKQWSYSAFKHSVDTLHITIIKIITMNPNTKCGNYENNTDHFSNSHKSLLGFELSGYKKDGKEYFKMVKSIYGDNGDLQIPISDLSREDFVKFLTEELTKRL